jgi:hypothetical protein
MMVSSMVPRNSAANANTLKPASKTDAMVNVEADRFLLLRMTTLR